MPLTINSRHSEVRETRETKMNDEDKLDPILPNISQVVAIKMAKKEVVQDKFNL